MPHSDEVAGLFSARPSGQIGVSDEDDAQLEDLHFEGRLSLRALNILTGNGISTVAGLRARRSSLLTLRYFGRGCMAEVDDILGDDNRSVGGHHEARLRADGASPAAPESLFHHTDERHDDATRLDLAGGWFREDFRAAARGSFTTRLGWILTRRWGLDGEPPQTLKTLAAELAITPERVRQVELDGLRRVGALVSAARKAAVRGETHPWARVAAHLDRQIAPDPGADPVSQLTQLGIAALPSQRARTLLLAFGTPTRSGWSSPTEQVPVDRPQPEAHARRRICW